MRLFLMVFMLVLLQSSNTVHAKSIITEFLLQDMLNKLNQSSVSGNHDYYLSLVDRMLDESVMISVESQASGVGELSIPYQQIMSKKQFMDTARDTIKSVENYGYEATLTGSVISPDQQSATFSIYTKETGKISTNVMGEKVSVSFTGLHSCINKAVIKGSKLVITDVKCKGTSEIAPSNL
jgi:hypothetical protein